AAAGGGGGWPAGGACVGVRAVRSPRASGGLAASGGAGMEQLVDPEARTPPLFRRSSLVLSALAALAVGVLLVRQPHLAGAESTHLHAMSTALLAHRIDARLLGFGETAVAVLALTIVARRVSRFAR